MAAISLPLLLTPPPLHIFSIKSSQSTSKFLPFSQSNPSPLLSGSSKLYTAAKARTSSLIAFAAKNLSESELNSVPQSVGEIAGKFPSDAGVYAVYDKDDDVQFIGITRNIAGSVATHWKSVPELCVSVKVGGVFFLLVLSPYFSFSALIDYWEGLLRFLR